MPCHSIPLSRSNRFCLHRPLHLLSRPLQLVPGLRRAGTINLEFMAGLLDQLDAELLSRRVPYVRPFLFSCVMDSVTRTNEM
jgi:hypothetical protein